MRPHDQPPDAIVRDQLARILSSELFGRSDRLSAFLRFIVEKTLSGEGDSLKEYVLAVELYGKGADFTRLRIRSCAWTPDACVTSSASTTLRLDTSGS
jgi:hypothetical protein